MLWPAPAKYLRPTQYAKSLEKAGWAVSKIEKRIGRTERIIVNCEDYEKRRHRKPAEMGDPMPSKFRNKMFRRDFR